MRLAPWQRLLVYGSLALVALSGVLWFALHDFISEEPDAKQRLLLIVHGTSSFAVLMAFGSLFPVHVRAGWLRGLNLFTGLGLIGGMAMLIVTALVLYYGSEESHFWAKWIHIGVGLAGIAVFPVHVICGYRSRRGAEQPCFTTHHATALTGASNSLPIIAKIGPPAPNAIPIAASKPKPESQRSIR